MSDDAEKKTGGKFPQLLVVLLILVIGGVVFWFFVDMKREINQLKATLARESRPTVVDAGDLGSPVVGDSESLTPDRCTVRIPHETVLDVVGKKGRVVFGCYEEALRRDPGLEGKLGLDLYVDSGGRVVKVEIVGMVKEDGLTRCLQESVLDWQFPRRDEDTCAWVEIPFMLTPQNLAETMKGDEATR